MAKTQAGFTAPIWRGAEYSRVAPRNYTAFATRIQGPEWCLQFQRYSLLVEFELMSEPDSVRVCLFLNMGSDPRKPPGRQSNFYKAWTIANGDMPKRGEAMCFDVFLRGQTYEIEVEDVLRNSKQGLKGEPEVYSRARQILSAKWRNQESLNQESGIRNQESSNQPIK